MCTKAHWGVIVLSSMMAVVPLLLMGSAFAPWYIKDHASGCDIKVDGFCEHDSGSADFIVGSIYVAGDGLCDNAWNEEPKNKMWCDYSTDDWCGDAWNSRRYQEELISDPRREVDESKLDTYCSKAKTGFAFALLGAVLTLIASITGCVQCCCEQMCFSLVATFLTIVSVLLILIHFAVMAAGKKDFDDCCTFRLDDDPKHLRGTEKLYLSIGFYCALGALIVTLIASICGGIGTWGKKTMKQNPSPGQATAAPVVVGQVVG